MRIFRNRLPVEHLHGFSSPSGIIVTTSRDNAERGVEWVLVKWKVSADADLIKRLSRTARHRKFLRWENSSREEKCPCWGCARLLSSLSYSGAVFTPPALGGNFSIGQRPHNPKEDLLVGSDFRGIVSPGGFEAGKFSFWLKNPFSWFEYLLQIQKYLGIYLSTSFTFSRCISLILFLGLLKVSRENSL